MSTVNDRAKQPELNQGRVISLTTGEFASTLDQNDLVIVDFWASWCVPCRTFAPVFEAAARSFPEVLFAKVNVDDEAELATLHQVRSIPTLIAYNQGAVAAINAGFITERRLNEFVEKLISSE